jgi:hypothetical protein
MVLLEVVWLILDALGQESPSSIENALEVSRKVSLNLVVSTGTLQILDWIASPTDKVRQDRVGIAAQHHDGEGLHERRDATTGEFVAGHARSHTVEVESLKVIDQVDLG